LDRLTTVSLFSGCGGSDLGATRAGAQILFVNDVKRDAIETYKKYKHMLAAPGVDIRRCDIRRLCSVPICDLLLGCYPCQSFSMGGHRAPESDPSSGLFRELRRCLVAANPKFFIAENVAGLAWLNGGRHLAAQVKEFEEVGSGYLVTHKLLNAKDYGVPADRKRVFIVGVRKDVGVHYSFPGPTYGLPERGLSTWASHGNAVARLPLNPEGEYYDYAKEPFPWWYLSRNRKRRWEHPSYAIIGNWRHVPLHPASPAMEMVYSNLADGWKQKWVFTTSYDHLDGHPERPALDKPRRLSWRECAVLQTFPPEFEPVGTIESKYWQIGNAVPPLLMEVIVRGITEGTCLVSGLPASKQGAARRSKLEVA
jgi:DNA (cytosine-5)-methyltransferase 1